MSLLPWEGKVPASPNPAAKQGPEPVLISRSQVDALYDLLEVVAAALDALSVDYILTGGSLLGAVRQHSILFTDDDVDVAVVDTTGCCLATVREKLPALLGPDVSYTVNAWEGSDRVRLTRVANVFLDLFCIRKYHSADDLAAVIGVKKNGHPQSDDYLQSIVQKIAAAAGDSSPPFPCWHFDRRKAVELWPKEVYRDYELLPISRNYKMGALTGLSGPHMPVTLLHRAFGQDCFTHYYQSTSHQITSVNGTTSARGTDATTEGGGGAPPLPPHVLRGGTWEGGRPLALEPEHYAPMQPKSRAKRRPTTHGKEMLLVYLREQSAREEIVVATANNATHPAPPESALTASGSRGSQQPQQQQQPPPPTIRPRRTVYMDGVFDLFHVGHVRAVEQCAALGDTVILGVTGDADAAAYKRPPVVAADDRAAVVTALRLVDRVIHPCPLRITQAFMEQHGIDLVVHGFCNEEDAAAQRDFFAIPMRLQKFQRIEYYQCLSTTDIIARIQTRLGDPVAASEPVVPVPALSGNNPDWFGATLAAATSNAPEIPCDPFPLTLRVVIEPHIAKARANRRDALAAVCQAAHLSEVEVLRLVRTSSPLAMEGEFRFDTLRHPLRSALLHCYGGLADDFDLTQLHTHGSGGKDAMMCALTTNFHEFQRIYDDFVLQICAPRLAGGDGELTEIYYQAFPCIRVVEPGDFSIGPHADIVYGHHSGSVNIYVPLTRIDGTAALFLESRPGSEDWHPIFAQGSAAAAYGTVKHFAGATCLHWTTENTAGYTRASLDFRMVPGPVVHALDAGVGSHFRQRGSYSCCRRRSRGVWQRVESALLPPDARVGFPWTVKDWDAYRTKKRGGA